METITNAAQAAAKVVWGEPGDTQEPVSGEAGDASKGEPFDAGNKDTRIQDKDHHDADTPGDDTSKGDATDSQNNTREPEETGTAEDEQVDLQGPGPKPLETVAAEHGGDAGNYSKESTSNSQEKKDEDQADTENDNQNKGTGEEYVKSSGLQADGGDFDATNPGAGREADRLMEEKGMGREESKEGGDARDSKSSDDNNNNKKDKPSLGERIKAKLHKS